MISNQAMRAGMSPISREVRAYFAPVDRASGRPAVFDPAKHGGFGLEMPPAPWRDLGPVDGLERRSGTKIESLRGGGAGAAAGQFRSGLEATVEFDFRAWGKLQMALAGGAEHMNVLASDANAAAAPGGGTPLPAIAVQAGSTDSEIELGEGAVERFGVGELVAVDVDYQQQTGFVGSGIAGAYVSDAAQVHHDVDYVRRVTFNVGRVAQRTATSLLLAQPLAGGAPANGAGVQKVVAFVDREGGAFFQEWSALLVVAEEAGGRICYYYPRLSPRGAGERERAQEIEKPICAVSLHAAFTALPCDDGSDGQTVLCYRSYFPAASAAVY